MRLKVIVYENWGVLSWIKTRKVENMFDKICLLLVIIGALNWGLVGLFEFDLVAWAFGSSTALLSRIVYTECRERRYKSIREHQIKRTEKEDCCSLWIARPGAYLVAYGNDIDKKFLLPSFPRMEPHICRNTDDSKKTLTSVDKQQRISIKDLLRYMYNQMVCRHPFSK